MRKFWEWLKTHDAAHAWIPFTVLLGAGLIKAFSNTDTWLANLGYMQMLGPVLLFLILLQAINEWLQAHDPQRDTKYGSRDNFIRNSKKDWTYFLGGLFSGTILFILLTKLI